MLELYSEIFVFELFWRCEVLMGYEKKRVEEHATMIGVQYSMWWLSDENYLNGNWYGMWGNIEENYLCKNWYSVW